MKKQNILNFKSVMIIFIVIGILSLVSYYLGFSICVFYNVTGVYCPSCGMTRAFVSLMHLDFKSAFMYNPMFIVVFLAILPNLIELFKPIKKSTKNMYFLILVIIVILVWIIRLCLYFPNDPMPYNSNNLFLKVYDTIKDGFR